MTGKGREGLNSLSKQKSQHLDQPLLDRPEDRLRDHRSAHQNHLSQGHERRLQRKGVFAPRRIQQTHIRTTRRSPGSPLGDVWRAKQMTSLEARVTLDNAYWVGDEIYTLVDGSPYLVDTGAEVSMTRKSLKRKRHLTVQCQGKGSGPYRSLEKDR